jgi:hypothetical protein
LPCIAAECLEIWQHACHGSTRELPIEPGRSFRGSLFTRRAGIHVDFHADGHFDYFRNLPDHCILPSNFGANSTPELNLGAPPTSRKCSRLKAERRYFSLGQSTFSPGQGAHEKIRIAVLASPTRKPERTQQSRAKHPDRHDGDRCGLAAARALHNFAGFGAIFGHGLFRD